jgi:Transcriptional regulator
MPRNEHQNKQIRDNRKEQILQAALRVFARRGMVATKISDIASEAGMSHGLVYHYFKSKDEIFVTLVQQASENSLRVIDAAAKRQSSPLDQLHWMTDQIIRDIDRGANAYLFLIMIQASTSEAVPEEVKQLLSGSATPVSATLPIIVNGQQAGEIVPGNPVMLAAAYYAVIQGLAVNKMQWAECPMPDPGLVIKMFRND